VYKDKKEEIDRVQESVIKMYEKPKPKEVQEKKDEVESNL
jgi:hypothetical protein